MSQVCVRGGCICRTRRALWSSRGGGRTGLTASGLPVRLKLMLRSLLAYPRVFISVAEGKHSGQCRGCKKVQKEARRVRASSMRNGPRHVHKRSGRITPIALVDSSRSAAGCKSSWAAGQACAVGCTKGAERFTFLAKSRGL